jgi:predicted dehydrogenase
LRFFAPWRLCVSMGYGRGRRRSRAMWHRARRTRWPISLEPFERQFRDFGDAIEKGRKPLCAGEEGYQALEVVDAVYRSCRSNEKVVL